MNQKTIEYNYLLGLVCAVCWVIICVIFGILTKPEQNFLLIVTTLLVFVLGGVTIKHGK